MIAVLTPSRGLVFRILNDSYQTTARYRTWRIRLLDSSRPSQRRTCEVSHDIQNARRDTHPIIWHSLSTFPDVPFISSAYLSNYRSYNRYHPHLTKLDPPTSHLNFHKLHGFDQQSPASTPAPHSKVTSHINIPTLRVDTRSIETQDMIHILQQRLGRPSRCGSAAPCDWSVRADWAISRACGFIPRLDFVGIRSLNHRYRGIYRGVRICCSSGLPVAGSWARLSRLRFGMVSMRWIGRERTIDLHCAWNGFDGHVGQHVLYDAGDFLGGIE